MRDVTLSPDGRSVAYVAPGTDQETRLYVADLESGETHFATGADGDPWEISGCQFVATERLVCGLYALIESTGYTIPFLRHVAVNADGSDPVGLGQHDSDYAVASANADSSVIDWLPGEEGQILMSRVYIPEGERGATRTIRTREGLGVVQIDTLSGDVNIVESPRTGINGFISDGRGTIRILMTWERRGATGDIGASLIYHYRQQGNNDWEDLTSYNTLTYGGFLPVAVDPELNVAYGFARHDGRMALQSIALDGSLRQELVFAHEEVDVDGLLRIGPADRVIGVTFADDYRRAEYFDPEYAQLATALSQAIPHLPNITIVDSTLDESILLIRASSDDDPGRYFVFRRDGNQLNEIMIARPELEGADLAAVRPIRYSAGDGVQVPGYLTMPPGREDARGLPAIVMPHGGPSARDEWGFDWLAQYFAYQGYAVLQPNYRGSAGYGDDWFVENGFQSWEIAIGDINAGGRWLVSEGIADPDQLAILGWSYGGYAALQSGVFEPDLFKAIVAIAPVTDLQLLKSQSRFWIGGRNQREFIGDGPHIQAGSPAQNAGRITAPVLMFHGDKDINVDIDQARRMQNRLENAGKRSELIVFENLDHSLDHSAARAELLQRSDAFLRNALGLPALGRDRASFEAGRSTRNSTPAETTARTPNFPG
ncbi:MAG: S9 family peptidase, partial [Sphingomonadales bacterium]|nr:S9 family peptidase [Sphingomonadales bacterium]